MLIKEITDQYGNDLFGWLVCEHCRAIQRLLSGYNDAYWHNRVLPAMHCKACGKDRAGQTEQETAQP